MTFSELQAQANRCAHQHGFWDGDLAALTPTRILSLLCLVHSEVSEACEEVRKNEMFTYYEDPTHLDYEKPKGFPSELADIIIRIADLAEEMNIDLETEIETKMRYNWKRPHMNGNKQI